MKEFVWQLYDCEGTFYARDYDEARKLVEEALTIQEVEQ